MMLARKWDRLEAMLEKDGTSGSDKAPPYDIFARIERDGNWTKLYQGTGKFAEGADGTVLAEVRDLRRYLLLVEAEMMARGAVAVPEQPTGIITFKGPVYREAGHHCIRRLDDGVEVKDMIDGVRYIRTQFIADDVPIYIVDRTQISEEEREQLLRLPLEINNKEFEESPAYYHSLYSWNGEKYALATEYREHWGRQP